MDVDEFIDLSCSDNVTKQSIQFFCDTFQNTVDSEQFVDFVLLSRNVKQVGGISDEVLETLLSLSKLDLLKNPVGLFLFIKTLDTIQSSRVYQALSVSGYSHMFDLFMLNRFRPVLRMRLPGRNTIPYNVYANKMYRNIKTCVDNKSFEGDVKQHLNDFRAETILGLRENTTQNIRQKLLERKVVLDVHLVQLYGVNHAHKRLEVLNNMKDIDTEGLDTTSLNLIYHSKMAVTYAKKGERSAAESHTRETVAICERCIPCFATVLALNDIMYAFQELCFFHRTPELLDKSRDNSLLFFHLHSTGEESTIHQWKRIILLFMAMTCLNISHEFEVGDITAVTDDDMIYAQALVDEVVKVHKNIEIRRQMVLNLCKGRLLEKGDYRCAKTYVQMAMDLAEDGCLRETERMNIQNYLNTLSRIGA